MTGQFFGIYNHFAYLYTPYFRTITSTDVYLNNNEWSETLKTY